MRIDKFLSAMGIASRSQSSRAAKHGDITIDGKICDRVDVHIDPDINVVTYEGQVIIYREYTYIMMNKPAGYVSATDDPKEKTVLELLPDQLQKQNLFPCGRLDKDTVGLLILTNNGTLAHQLLSPKHHAEKVYYFRCADPLTDIAKLEQGIKLDDGYTTLPSKIDVLGTNEGYITLTEGKYHQIKRMFGAVGNRITYLRRVEFGGVELDESLKLGKWRYLTDDEINILKRSDT
jgi:pseudouridine synthase